MCVHNTHIYEIKSQKIWDALQSRVTLSRRCVYTIQNNKTSGKKNHTIGLLSAAERRFSAHHLGALH